MFQITPRFRFMKLFYDNRPRAYAQIQGSADYPDIKGLVYFYHVPGGGVLIEAEIFGLPDSQLTDPHAFYAFHLHEEGDCSDNFSKTGNHYNPKGKAHPMHAGDLPPLIANDGYAWLAFFDRELELYDIIGKSILIHGSEDDFTTQPSGNAGGKIGCGVIQFMDDWSKEL